MIAALYVAKGGVYWDRSDVDAWDESRDARLYAGPHPVVAHPPCGRWCKLAKLVQARWGHKVGNDGGCFDAALASVRAWGGVLEHPAWSLAWSRHGLNVPLSKGWQRDIYGNWSCEVSQCAYGHPAQKLTWLYYVGSSPPAPLDWSRPKATMVVGHMSRRGDGTIWRNNAKRMHGFSASKTPPAFAEALLDLARNSQRKAGAA